MLASQYQLAGRDIVSETFDGDTVVLDLASGRYFSFTTKGCAVWEALVAGVTPQAMLADPALTSAAVESFLRKLVQFRLISPRGETMAPPGESAWLDRLTAAQDAPDVFVFDDLADLFTADPIHDVDEEAGWPVLRQA